jgi:hypothetical protein
MYELRIIKSILDLIAHHIIDSGQAQGVEIKITVKYTSLICRVRGMYELRIIKSILGIASDRAQRSAS